MVPLPDYQCPWFLPGAHLQTAWPSLFRRPPRPAYRRERISTHDDDFLDLDWLQSGQPRLAIISHGLEGDSQRHYVVGMAQALFAGGWDVLAWNFRGCSGEINRQPRFTHNGATDDLAAVVEWALAQHAYEQVVLVGFSMGGNLSLVYLGKEADQVPDRVSGAICFSVPCDLAAASERLAEQGNTLYMKRFLRLMGKKIVLQAARYPDLFPCDDYHTFKTFRDFDNRYTAPLHGFRDAHDYWQQCSSLRYLADIRVPVWIVNALNDPFLSPSCSPGAESHGNARVRLLAPRQGGHCGFVTPGRGPYWSERMALILAGTL